MKICCIIGHNYELVEDEVLEQRELNLLYCTRCGMVKVFRFIEKDDKKNT